MLAQQGQCLSELGFRLYEVAACKQCKIALVYFGLQICTRAIVVSRFYSHSRTHALGHGPSYMYPVPGNTYLLTYLCLA